jgi:hypothetical protein
VKETEESIRGRRVERGWVHVSDRTEPGCDRAEPLAAALFHRLAEHEIPNRSASPTPWRPGVRDYAGVAEISPGCA